MSDLRVRFAPSPTGYLHVGGARTALFNWLLAKQQGGKFILRIEDTDLERSTQESVDAIFEGMNWLGLTHDEGPFYQTQCFDLYKKYIQQLLDSGKAYKCYCTKEELDAKRELAVAEKRKAKYDGTCRDILYLNEIYNELKDTPYVVRFKAPQEGRVEWVDAIKGKVSFPCEELDDLIIQRTDGSPTYNFCVVIDDALMKISLVIRGDDHVNNTPRQIQLYEALGFPIPQFAHVPMILGADKARLSKRHGATSVMAYRDMGFLPEALLNYLVRLGWSHGDQEIFSVAEMIEKFDLAHVGKAAGVFNMEKLLWLNQRYIKEADPTRLAKLLTPILNNTFYPEKFLTVEYSQLILVVKSLQTRSKTLVEMADQAVPFYKAPVNYDEVALGKIDTALSKIVLLEAIREFKECSSSVFWSATPESVDKLTQRVLNATGFKMKDLGAVLRLALFGKPSTPPLGDVISILGAEETLKRLSNFLKFLK